MKNIIAVLAAITIALSASAQQTVTVTASGAAVTNTLKTIPSTNVLADLGISGSLSSLFNAVEASDILQATNWALAPYLTYAPSASDKVGGGILAVYNVPQLTGSLGAIGAALGADWLGGWSLVSGNVTIQFPTHPLASISWLSFLPATVRNVTMVPIAVAGIGQPMANSSSSGAATLWDVGDQIKFGHWLGGNFGVGVTWGEWMNAGKESGHRYHLFLDYQMGF